MNCPDGNEYYRCEEQIAFPLKSDGTEDKLIALKLSTDEGNLPVLEINFKISCFLPKIKYHIKIVSITIFFMFLG